MRCKKAAEMLQFLSNFYMSGVLLLVALYWSGPIFAGNSRSAVYAYMPYFIWIRLLFHLPWQILTLDGSSTSPLYQWESNLKVDPRSTLRRKISSRSVHPVALLWRKTLNFAVFGGMKNVERGFTSRRLERVEQKERRLGRSATRTSQPIR